jgi:hypothetical protein
MHDIKKLACEIGFTKEYLKRKVELTLELAKEKGLDFSLPVFVGYDMNGPLTSVDSATLHPYPNVKKCISMLGELKCYPCLISGWDLTSLRFFRDKRLEVQMGIIGELGAIYEFEGKIYEPFPVEEEKYYEIVQSIYEKAAELKLKVAKQGNLSKRVICVYFEADSAKRGNLANHFLRKEITTKDIFEKLENKNNFEFDGKKIKFEPAFETIKEIDNILTKIYPLCSVRLAKNGDKIAIWIDKGDNPFSLEEMASIAKQIAPKGWEIDINQDFCVDFVYEGDKVKLNKEKTANIFAKRVFDEEFILTNVGDKKGDVLLGENTIFFAQYCTEAENYCKENDIPYVPVVNGIDYTLIMAEILKMW